MPLETDYPPPPGLPVQLVLVGRPDTHYDHHLGHSHSHTTWIISIYSENDCTGDHCLVTGHNKDSLDTKCSVIADLGTTDTATSTSCRWYSGGS